jgi:hypothetical protein
VGITTRHRHRRALRGRLPRHKLRLRHVPFFRKTV